MPFTLRPFRCFPVCRSVTYYAGPFLKLALAYCSGFWFLITLLVLSSGPAYAEWELLYRHDDRGETMYVDTDTIRRKGDVVKWWELYDHKTVQTDAGHSYLSSKVQREYDCAEERNRTLAYTWFSGHMGSGTVVYNSSNKGKWAPVAPGSVGQALWKAACNKQ